MAEMKMGTQRTSFRILHGTTTEKALHYAIQKILFYAPLASRIFAVTLLVNSRHFLINGPWMPESYQTNPGLLYAVR